MPEIVNNIDMTALTETKKKVEASGGHLYLEKHIDGEFHFSGSPMFTAVLSSQNATFTVGADEPPCVGR